MSSKENKRMAQERRAKQREEAQKKANLQKTVIGAGIVIVLAVLILLPGFYGQDTKSTDEETEETADAQETTEASEDAEPQEDAQTEETGESERKLDTTEGREVADGDTVNIDYTGYKDGEPFDGGSTNGAGADLTIGSNTYIDGFESGLIGKKVGETVDLNLTFPEDYGVEDLAGADVVFNVTINGIYDE